MRGVFDPSGAVSLVRAKPISLGGVQPAFWVSLSVCSLEAIQVYKFLKHARGIILNNWCGLLLTQIIYVDSILSTFNISQWRMRCNAYCAWWLYFYFYDVQQAKPESNQ